MDPNHIAPMFVLLLALLGLLLAVIWIILPFAIFGTKPLLRELIAEQRRTNQLLADLSTRGLPPMSI